MREEKKQLKAKFSEKSKIKHILLMIFILLVYYWAIKGTNTSASEFVRGIPFMIDYIKRMLPPDFTMINLFLFRAGETIQIAIMGTTLGAILAFPLSFFAARNIMPIKIVYQSMRTFFDACRGINEVVWAILFVSMVGLGPFPGVLALTVHLTGALGKYFSEAIENVNPEIINAIAATGANKIQIVFHAVIPQIKSLFVGYIFYYFEHSVRAATVLGLVGAGGIGIELLTSIKLFKLKEVSAIMIVMVLMVTIIDRASAYVRNRIIRA